MSGRTVAALLALLALAACSPKRPVLYPNQRLYDTGREMADAEIDRCVQLAADYGHQANPKKDVAKNTATGAAVGGAVGGAAGAASRGSAGAATHGSGQRAAAGAAGGAVLGFFRGLFRSRDPDPIERRFVEQCLRDEGYQPIGWD